MRLQIDTKDGKKVFSDLEMLTIMQKELTNHLYNLPNVECDFELTKPILKEWYRKLANEKRALTYLNTKQATCQITDKYIIFNSRARVIMGLSENDVLQIERNDRVLQVSFSPQGQFQMTRHIGSQGLWSQKRNQIEKLLNSGIAKGKYVFLQNFGNVYHFKREDDDFDEKYKG